MGVREGAGKGRGLATGCLSVWFVSLALGFAISYLSILDSARFVGHGFWSTCPDGFVAGSPYPFVEYDGVGADPNDTPSSLSRLMELGSTQTEFCIGSYVVNSVYWSLPALVVLSLVGMIVRAMRSGAANDDCGRRHGLEAKR